MDTTFFTILALGFALGIKHALDADHVVAVSAIVSRYRQPLKAALVGAYWGIGHTSTLFLAGIAVILFKLAISDQLALSMEFLVGIALLVLGIQTLLEQRPKETHAHEHEHQGQTHSHYHIHRPLKSDQPIQHHSPSQHRSLIMGMIHGLAGSGALTLLVLGTTRSAWEGIVYILIFGLGSILGMVIITMLIGLPFALSSTRMTSLNRTIRLGAGALSSILGLIIMFEIGVVQGLFVGFL